MCVCLCLRNNMLLLCVLWVSAVLADLKLNQSEMVTTQPEVISNSSFHQQIFTSSDHLVADWTTNETSPQQNVSLSSNFSGFSHLAGRRTFHKQQQQQQEEWRIIGGQEAKPFSWPWLVSVQYANMPACGGAIIHPFWVLSATHCFLRYNKAFWRVVAGKHDLKNPEPSEQVVKVVKIISHEHYDARSKEHDVTLLKLEKPLTINEWVRPIDICGAALPSDRKCTITGWGATRENGNRVNRLHEVKVSIMSSRSCNELYAGRMRDSMFCAGKVAGGADACQGDSGGPLSCPMGGNLYQLAGLVSWGVGCGRVNKPGVYVRLGLYIDWISEVIATDGMFRDDTDADAVPCGQTSSQIPSVAPPQATLTQHGQVGGVFQPRPGSWLCPWQVSLQAGHHHYCSGVLLQDRWVLTARHCRVRAENDVVVLGKRLGFQSSLPIPIKQVFHPPLKMHSTLFPDLVLLQLLYPARLDSGVTQVCIPDEDEEPNDSWSCVTTGWGNVKTAEPLDPNQLHQVGLSLVNYTTCREQWEAGLVQEAHICSHPVGSSSCLGDPAAPLFCRKKGAYFLFGILSLGSSRCGDDKPAIFTKVADFESWIYDVTGGA